MVEQLTPDPEIKGLNPAAPLHSEKTEKTMYHSLASCSSTMVENSTSDTEIKGLNPAAGQHEEKKEGENMKV